MCKSYLRCDHVTRLESIKLALTLAKSLEWQPCCSATMAAMLVAVLLAIATTCQGKDMQSAG